MWYNYFSKKIFVSDENCLGILPSMIGISCINQLTFDHDRSSAHHYYLTSLSSLYDLLKFGCNNIIHRDLEHHGPLSERNINYEDFKIYVNIVMSSQNIVTYDYASSVLHFVRMHEETIKLLSKKIAQPINVRCSDKNL